MSEAAADIEQTIAPRIIRISSKRQLTIPADMYAEASFKDYAYIVLREDGGLDITPIDVQDESASVRILRSLLDQGFDGKDLVDEYERIIAPVTDHKKAIEAGLEDFKKGRVAPFEDMQERLRRKYDL